MSERLKDRPLQPGRGRVWQMPGYGWAGDYRDSRGVGYGVWAESLSEAADWIREKAKS